MTIIVQKYNTKKHINLNCNPTLLFNIRIRGFYQCIPLSNKNFDGSFWQYLPLWSYEISELLKICVGIIFNQGTFFYGIIFRSGVGTNLIKSRCIFDSTLSDVCPGWNNLFSLPIQCHVWKIETIFLNVLELLSTEQHTCIIYNT